MTERRRLIFNPPPGWPKPPDGGIPPKGRGPDPSWSEPPPGWQLWIEEGDGADGGHVDAGPDTRPPGPAQHPVNDSGPVTPTNVDHRVALLEAENAALRARLELAGTDANEVVLLDDERVLQEVG